MIYLLYMISCHTYDSLYKNSIRVWRITFKRVKKEIVFLWNGIQHSTRAVIRGRERGWGRGRGFSPAKMNVACDYFQRKIIRKIESKDTSSCLISHLLFVFTQVTWNLSDNHAQQCQCLTVFKLFTCISHYPVLIKNSSWKFLCGNHHFFHTPVHVCMISNLLFIKMTRTACIIFFCYHTYIRPFSPVLPLFYYW